MALKDLLEAARRRLSGDVTPPQLKSATRENIRLSNPWHAVTVQPGPKRCDAVNQIVGQRFLSKDAPKLPLRNCTEASCSCHYRHYDDRRLEGTPLDRNGMPLPNPGRRSGD